MSSKTTCTNFVKILPALVLVVMCMALSACGSGEGGGTAVNAAASDQVAGSVASGIFVDAPIAGLTYESGHRSGVTDANGNFSYIVGSRVTFKVGDILMGSSTGSGIITPINISGDGSNADSPGVVAMVQFLLTIADMDANGNLSIPPSVARAAAGKSINFNAPDAEAQVSAVAAAMVPNKKLATAEAAKQHMKSSLNKLAAGTYRGSWSAPASIPSSGSFTVTVNQNGSMHGVATLGRNIVDVTSTMSSNLISGSIYAIKGTVSNGAVWSGTINLAQKTLSGRALYDGVDATFNARQ